MTSPTDLERLIERARSHLRILEMTGSNDRLEAPILTELIAALESEHARAEEANRESDAQEQAKREALAALAKERERTRYVNEQLDAMVQDGAAPVEALARRIVAMYAKAKADLADERVDRERMRRLEAVAREMCDALEYARKCQADPGYDTDIEAWADVSTRGRAAEAALIAAVKELDALAGEGTT